MNEVMKIFKIIFLLSLAVKYESAKIKTKGDFLISDLGKKSGSHIIKTPNISHKNDVEDKNADFHHVFAVKTNYSNRYNPSSPLIDARNPAWIHSGSDQIKIDKSSIKNDISENNNNNYGKPLTRPISADPYIKNLDYQSINIPQNFQDFKSNFQPDFKHYPNIKNKENNTKFNQNNLNTNNNNNNNNNLSNLYKNNKINYQPDSYFNRIFPVQSRYNNRFYINKLNMMRNRNAIAYERQLNIIRNEPQYVQKQNRPNVYNPMPVMTHYNMPILHHIPVNQLVRRYVPVYYPVPVEHRINIPVQIPIRVPQRVLIPQAVPFGVKIPVPIPVRVEIPQYKEYQVQKPVYVKIPIYEHIPVYHHFAMKDDQKIKEEDNSKLDEDCDELSSENKAELNKQLQNYLRKNMNQNK